MTAPDITWAEMQDLVASAIGHSDQGSQPADPMAELSVLDVLSGDATWEELDACRTTN